MLAIASLFVCGFAAGSALAPCPAPASPGEPSVATVLAAVQNGKSAKAGDKDAGAKPKADAKAKSAPTDADGAERPAPLAIRAAKLYVRPDRVLEGVTIVVEDGKVTALGADVQAPAKARKLEAKVVTAGFIDAWSSFALDSTSFGDERITPASTAVDAVDPYVDPRWEREILRAGVTAYRLQPSPSARVAGLGALMRLHPERLLIESTLLGDCSLALTMGVGRAGVDVFDRAADTERVLGALSDGWSYLEEKNEYKHELAEWEKKIAEKQKELDDGFKKAKKDREKAQSDAKEKGTEFKEKEYKEDKKPKAPRYDEDKEVLARAANGEFPVVVEVHNAAQIRALLESTRRFQRARIVLAGASDARLFAKELAERRIPVLVSPQALGFARPTAQSDVTLSLAAELEDAGVEVLLGSGGRAGLASRELPLLAALAIGHGLSPSAALAAVTTRPARVFDVAHRIGSVEVGREADLVLFDGEPFAAATKVKYVICGGDLVVEE